MNMSKSLRAEYNEFEHAIYENAPTPEGAYKLADELFKLARSYQRLQEAYCNYGLTPRQESRERNIEKRITEIAQKFGCGVVFNGDPRGATVKLVFPNGKTNDWGREGWCVPTF